MNALKAADVMTRDVFTLQETATVREAATALIERRISGAPVVDAAGKLSGLLSEEDLIGVFYEGVSDLDRRPIGTCTVLGSSLVTRKVVAVRPETALHDIAKKLLNLKIKRVPVVDAEHRVLGVVSRKDILKALVKS
ncbi:MAG TPA: CBS domain-containing protein [Planctomycetota bacterium]|nr:CBS domain-containing protein [Planctomycetota bacterium]